MSVPKQNGSERAALRRTNEGKVCDAVIRLLEDRTQLKRRDLRAHADAGNGKNVEARFRLGSQEYAIEHTRINSFDNQVRVELLFEEFRRPIITKLAGALPGRGYWKLCLPSNIGRRIKRRGFAAAQRALIDWLPIAAARLLSERASGKRPAWSGNPPGLDFKVTLLHETNATGIDEHDGLLLIMSEGPIMIDERRRKELADALGCKCPKLQSCKDAGAISVLALETDDWTTCHLFLAPELWNAFATRQDMPDEVYLVDTTAGEFWPVVPLTRGDRVLSGHVPVEVLPDQLVDITATLSG
ncbi:hypothetical protein [Bradyrhizobium sp.]|uniref:hypothetical protein n=1 Tax=Bradyrhizobium sp. TaxID=376 RepID=UPI003C70A692